jgi:hypothetical protein
VARRNHALRPPCNHGARSGACHPNSEIFHLLISRSSARQVRDSRGGHRSCRQPGCHRRIGAHPDTLSGDEPHDLFLNLLMNERVARLKSHDRADGLGEACIAPNREKARSALRANTTDRAARTFSSRGLCANGRPYVTVTENQPVPSPFRVHSSAPAAGTASSATSV